MASLAGRKWLRIVGVAVLLVMAGCSSYKEYILDQVRYSKGAQSIIVNMVVIDDIEDDDTLVLAKAGVSYHKPDSSGYVIVKSVTFTDHSGGVAFQCENQRLGMQRAFNGQFFARKGFGAKAVKFGDFTAKGVVEVYDDKDLLVESFVIDGVIKSKMVKKNAWVSRF